MLKKSIKSLIVLLFSVLIIPSFVSAELLENKFYPKDMDIVESTEVFSTETFDEDKVKINSIDVSGVDEKTGEIVDEKKFKESLLEFFNTDPIGYAGIIQDIDSIVEQSLSNAEVKHSLDGLQLRLLPNEITPAFVNSGWIQKPYLVKSENRVKYKTSWILEDNYRSSVPITASYKQTSSTSIGIGFTGSGLIGGHFGFTASKTSTQISEISQGANVPGWTAWGHRPYIRYTKNDYVGKRYDIVSTIGGVKLLEYVVSGSNNRLRIKANDYWSRTNSSRNVNLRTPTPPTGAP